MIGLDQQFTYGNYLEVLSKSVLKLELVSGQIRQLGPKSLDAVTLQDNLLVELLQRCENHRVMGSEMIIALPQAGSYYFPDLSAIAKQDRNFLSSDPAQLLNPTMIVEVVEQETFLIDRVEKFRAYFSIPSFIEYVLVDSESVRVDTFYQEGADHWSMRSYYRMDDEVEFRSMGVKLPISVIYADVTQ